MLLAHYNSWIRTHVLSRCLNPVMSTSWHCGHMTQCFHNNQAVQTNYQNKCHDVLPFCPFRVRWENNLTFDPHCVCVCVYVYVCVCACVNTDSRPSVVSTHGIMFTSPGRAERELSAMTYLQTDRSSIHRQTDGQVLNTQTGNQYTDK